LTVPSIVPQDGHDDPRTVGASPPGRSAAVGRSDPPWFYPGPVSLESRAQRLMADNGGNQALSITDLYARVDRAVRSSFPEEVWITGEIRSLKVNANGHCFIDLV